MRSLRRTGRLLGRMLLAGGVLASGVVLPATTTAHPAKDWYPREWKNDLQVEWSFTKGYPARGGRRNRVKDAARAWNRLGQPMRFVWRKDIDNLDPRRCPSREQKDGVHWRIIDGNGNTLAETYRCYAGGRLHSFQITFDKQERWYGGKAKPPRGRFDLWSVAAHEFGHATGFSGHFSAGTRLCKGSGQNTMCPLIRRGSRAWRTLERHDRDTFRNAY